MPSSAIGAGAARYSRPLTRTRPAEGSSRPAIIRIVVDLPAPFGPRKPVTTPGRTTKSSPLTASFAPYRLLRFSTSIIACSLPSVTPVTPGTPPTLGITRPARHRPRGHKPTRPPMPQGLPAGGQGRLGVHRERVPAHPHIRGPTGPAQVSVRLCCRRPGQSACPRQHACCHRACEHSPARHRVTHRDHLPRLRFFYHYRLLGEVRRGKRRGCRGFPVIRRGLPWTAR